jgi:hypothetical protein
MQCPDYKKFWWRHKIGTVIQNQKTIIIIMVSSYLSRKKFCNIKSFLFLKWRTFYNQITKYKTRDKPYYSNYYAWTIHASVVSVAIIYWQLFFWYRQITHSHNILGCNMAEYNGGSFSHDLSVWGFSFQCKTITHDSWYLEQDRWDHCKRKTSVVLPYTKV